MEKARVFRALRQSRGRLLPFSRSNTSLSQVFIYALLQEKDTQLRDVIMESVLRAILRLIARNVSRQFGSVSSVAGILAERFGEQMISRMKMVSMNSKRRCDTP